MENGTTKYNDDGYAICDHAGAMSFGDAIEAMRAGNVVERVAWKNDGLNKCIRLTHIQPENELFFMLTRNKSVDNDERFSTSFSPSAEDVFGLDWLVLPTQSA